MLQCSQSSACVPLGLDVREVAHDMHTQVSKYVTSDLGLANSYDPWHGMSIYLKMYSLQQWGNRIEECCKAIEEDFSGSGEEPWGFMVS